MGFVQFDSPQQTKAPHIANEGPTASPQRQLALQPFPEQGGTRDERLPFVGVNGGADGGARERVRVTRKSAA
jgi:hypothetical protein